mmetsp:Transcript_10546/g.41153  ORF Transcript_10546/g.41153 Transcript_10546/m.41153 type:complete len:419 (+) Transcript_10546:1286-2542(+)
MRGISRRRRSRRTSLRLVSSSFGSTFSFFFSPFFPFSPFFFPFGLGVLCASYRFATRLHHVLNSICLYSPGSGIDGDGGIFSVALGAGLQKKVAATRDKPTDPGFLTATLCLAAGNAPRVILSSTLPTNTVATSWPCLGTSTHRPRPRLERNSRPAAPSRTPGASCNTIETRLGSVCTGSSTVLSLDSDLEAFETPASERAWASARSGRYLFTCHCELSAIGPKVSSNHPGGTSRWRSRAASTPRASASAESCIARQCASNLPAAYGSSRGTPKVAPSLKTNPSRVWLYPEPHPAAWTPVAWPESAESARTSGSPSRTISSHESMPSLATSKQARCSAAAASSTRTHATPHRRREITASPRPTASAAQSGGGASSSRTAAAGSASSEACRGFPPLFPMTYSGARRARRVDPESVGGGG